MWLRFSFIQMCPLAPQEGFLSFYFDLLFLPSKNVVPLCMQAFSSTSVTMVLLRKSSLSRSSWNYLQLGFTVQPGDAGLHLSLVKPFPVCVLGWVQRQHPLQGTAVARSPRSLSGLVGTRSPLLRVRPLCRCVTCYFQMWGCILGSDEPWKARSCSSPPGTGLSAAC